MELKHYGYALAAATALASIMAAATLIRPAFATQEVINPEQQQQEDQQERLTESTTKWAFVCVPDKKKHQKLNEVDPTVRVRITAEFQGEEEWKLTDLTVVHETYSGRNYDRGEQYARTGFYGRLQPTEYLWIWNGQQKDDPTHILTGGLFWNGEKDQRWHYGERHEIARGDIKRRIKGKSISIKQKPKITWIFTTCIEARKQAD